MGDSKRQEALADFLRTRRERLTPPDVGLPMGSRRRTPGLRREEVAQLANVGTSWYTALEQGRDVHPSAQVLESLAEALRLTPSERQHLFILARQNMPISERLSQEPMSPVLEQVVHALNPHPAYVMGRRWDVLTWNKAAEKVFTFSNTLPPHDRNLVWRYFTDPTLRERNSDWERHLQAVVARFRADTARYPGDAGFAELIEDLQQISPEFRRWWSQHDVRDIPDGRKVINHPRLGRLEFGHVTLQVPMPSGLRVVIYAASPATADVLERFLLTGDLAAAGQAETLSNIGCIDE